MQRGCNGNAEAFNSGRESTRRGAIQPERLSWEDAVEEAGKWIGALRLGRNLDGQTIDLTEPAKSLQFEGRFRQMIFESVRRKLKKRGARDVIFPPVDTEKTYFIIRPHRGGWQCFEAPGVQPYYVGPNARAEAIGYALENRTAHRRGEIRIFNAAGELEETIPFDESGNTQRV